MRGGLDTPPPYRASAHRILVANGCRREGGSIFLANFAGLMTIARYRLIRAGRRE